MTPVSSDLLLISYLTFPSAPPNPYNLCHHPKPDPSFLEVALTFSAMQFKSPGGERRREPGTAPRASIGTQIVPLQTHFDSSSCAAIISYHFST